MPPWKIWVSVGLGAVMGAGVTVAFIIFSLMNFSGPKLALVFLVGWAACAALVYGWFYEIEVMRSKRAEMKVYIAREGHPPPMQPAQTIIMVIGFLGMVAWIVRFLLR